MPSTPALARRAFLESVPRMRQEYDESRELFLDEIFHVANYPAHYAKRILRLASKEMHRRNERARDRIRDLLDSGWKPDAQMTTRRAFTECFQFEDSAQDPTSDLYASIEPAADISGVPRATLMRNLGTVQTQAAKAAISDLEVYVLKKEAQSINNTFNAPAIVQVGDGNTVYLDVTSLNSIAQMIEHNLNEFTPADRQSAEADLIVLNGELEKPKPSVPVMKEALSRIGDLAKSAGSETIKALIAEAVKHLFAGA